MGLFNDQVRPKRDCASLHSTTINGVPTSCQVLLWELLREVNRMQFQPAWGSHSRNQSPDSPPDVWSGLRFSLCSAPWSRWRRDREEPRGQSFGPGPKELAWSLRVHVQKLCFHLELLSEHLPEL